MLKFILVLFAIISTSFASVNGPCSGRNGICIDSGKCSSYGGSTFTGKCPRDPNSIKCCDNIPCKGDDGRSGTCVFSNQCSGDTASGKCPGGTNFKCCLSGSSTGGGSTTGGSSGKTYYGPCNGGGGACIDITGVSCDTSTVNGKCPGGSNVKCCVSGGKPSWYINQNEYTQKVCTYGGEAKSVATSGCGAASLAMALGSIKGSKVNPTDLFREAYNAGKYSGDGLSHGTISWLGKNHGVSVSWTDNINSVYSALESGKGVIFHTKSDSKYHFTTQGHYIFLKGAKTQGGIKKVYVFDPNGRHNYANVLFALKSSDGGIEMAKRGSGEDFGIVSG